MLMTNKNPFPDLTFSTILSLRQSGHPLPCSHTPSKFTDVPYLERSMPWQGFLALEGKTTKAYTCLKTIIPIVACSWKSMDTIGYQFPTMDPLLKCFTNILMPVPIPFVFYATNSCRQF